MDPDLLKVDSKQKMKIIKLLTGNSKISDLDDFG